MQRKVERPRPPPPPTFTESTGAGVWQLGTAFFIYIPEQTSDRERYNRRGKGREAKGGGKKHALFRVNRLADLLGLLLRLPLPDPPLRLLVGLPLSLLGRRLSRRCLSKGCRKRLLGVRGLEPGRGKERCRCRDLWHVQTRRRRTAYTKIGKVQVSVSVNTMKQQRRQGSCRTRHLKYTHPVRSARYQTTEETSAPCSH